MSTSDRKTRCECGLVLVERRCPRCEPLRKHRHAHINDLNLEQWEEDEIDAALAHGAEGNSK